ncbi:aminotransferase class I/II-fold pyridoxal phosphate-dependent enzyme [Tumebacillus permanentifrigoris]|uniref:Arginine decarboxylase n=1 Tax=Tumebacillus permanentifrigoris TaxID=378543 RepID=A0A316D5L4_9BACL|nr:aminotransferase class I/II-fold pyridoxal phosphate-dependent enzyme [Tumebacillus permanentifrigoris]PWK07956.1 arginine decarboxylase [Tumebacillus permanentifrigoris]
MSISTIPIMQAILSHLKGNPGSYHVPGHKMGRGLDGAMGSWLSQASRLDLTEIPGLDDLHAPEGAIREAQRLAAEAFGAQETYFLVNGSTAGNLAMILTAISPGEKLLVPRNLHKSVLNGLVLAQAQPVFYHPEVDEQFGIASGVAVETVREIVQAHPDARALLIVSPTYHGICSDLRAVAEIVHTAGMMLLVDEAHGAHFAFHEALPATAMQAGADMAVQSTHKTLGALTQASMLHVQGTRVDRTRLRKRLQLVQSTSPSYLLLASLDVARHQMQTEGHARLEQALQAVEKGAERLRAHPHLHLLQKTPGGFEVDPLKWTISVAGLGKTGSHVYEYLHAEKHLTLELSDPQNVLAVFSYADGERQVERLVQALEGIPMEGASEGFRSNEVLQARSPSEELTKSAQTKSTANSSWSSLEAKFLPHVAFEMDTESVPLQRAAGRCAGEMVIPYPPGIPLIVPGEVWTEELIAHVEALRATQVRFQGVEDSQLLEVRVLLRT